MGAPVGATVGVCAWTDDGAAATVKAKAIATATSSLRQVPISFARESRDEQHMNAISKKERRPGVKSKIPRPR
jgi:hypothetical protein